MVNECINRLEIEGPTERLLYLLGGPDPVMAMERGERPLQKAPALFELLGDIEGMLEPHPPRFELMRDRAAIVFETRETAPIEEIASFAGRFPDIRVRHSFAEPSMALFGHVVYEHGAETSFTTYRYETEADAAFAARGWDYERDLRLNTLLFAGALGAAQSGCRWNLATRRGDDPDENQSGRVASDAPAITPVAAA